MSALQGNDAGPCSDRKENCQRPRVQMEKTN
jgi:hypothetical protein